MSFRNRLDALVASIKTTADQAAAAAQAAGAQAAAATTAAETATGIALSASEAAQEAATLAADAATTATDAAGAAADAHNAAILAQGAADAATIEAAAAQSAADTAAAEALAAAGLAGSKGKVLIQPDEPDAADREPQNLWIDTIAALNTPKRWAGATWEPVTDKAAIDAANAAAAAQATANSAGAYAAAAMGAASAAQSTADAAASAASTAQSAADTAAFAAGVAQATANGKNKITRSTDAPTALTPGETPGDLWWRYASGIVIGQWVWSGSAWVAMTLDGAILANLDAGTITTGLLDAERIAARSIKVDRLALGALTMNAVRNPGFEETGDNPPVPGTSVTAVPGWTAALGTSGRTDIFRWAAGANARSGQGYAVAWSGTAAASGVAVQSEWMPVIPGTQYFFQAMVRNLHASCQARLAIYHNTTPSGTGTLVTLHTASPTVAGGWFPLFGTWTPAAGRTWVRIEVQNRGLTPHAVNRALVVDDIAMLLYGQSAMEITPELIRFWDGMGQETGRWDPLAIKSPNGIFDNLGVAGNANINGQLDVSEVQAGFVSAVESYANSASAHSLAVTASATVGALTALGDVISAGQRVLRRAVSSSANVAVSATTLPAGGGTLGLATGFTIAGHASYDILVRIEAMVFISSAATYANVMIRQGGVAYGTVARGVGGSSVIAVHEFVIPAGGSGGTWEVVLNAPGAANVSANADYNRVRITRTAI